MGHFDVLTSEGIKLYLLGVKGNIGHLNAVYESVLL